MAYVLDTSMLIDAKNDYYRFALCPGFWDWLEREAAAGQVLSIVKVRAEILEGQDELAAWARRQSPEFFRPEDTLAAQAMRRVSDWVQAGDFKDEAKRRFLAGADPYLIAYALAHGHTVVTHEVSNAGNATQRNKVKIPAVCLGLTVPSEPAFPWLVRRGAKFVLDRPNETAPLQTSLFATDS